MEKYSTWRRLGTYSVNRPMIQHMTDALNGKIPTLLHFRNASLFSGHSSLVIYGSGSSEIYHPVSSYTQPLFHNDTETVAIELLYKEDGDPTASRAIVVEMRFGQEREDCYLSIALQDTTRSKEKVLAIEEALLTELAPHKNRNWITYPNDFIPTFVFLAGFVIGLSSLMFVSPFLKMSCLLFFGTAIYYVARRFVKGYCDFESRHQQRLDFFLKGLAGAVVVLALIAAWRIL